MYDYVDDRRICYGDEDDEIGILVFVPKCLACGRYVKTDEDVSLASTEDNGLTNATCKKCGRMKMLFEGFV